LFTSRQLKRTHIRTSKDAHPAVFRATQ
jgi:hypothetical protein